VNFLQLLYSVGREMGWLLYRVGEGDGAPFKPSLYLEPFSK